MLHIDVLSDDRIYADMLVLELAAAGYRAVAGYSGYSDVVVWDADSPLPADIKYDISFSVSEGADLLRPFDISELLSMIEGREGRGAKNADSVQELYLSPAEQRAYFRGEAIALSDVEYRMLAILYNNKNQYVETAGLAEDIFGDPASLNPVRVYMSYLRNKLDEAYKVKLIYTARGKGYMLKL